MKKFYLQRNEDFSGVSGTGRVAEGIVFTDGRACMLWLTHTPSLGIYDSIDELEHIHSHEGRTLVMIETEEGYKPLKDSK